MTKSSADLLLYSLAILSPVVLVGAFSSRSSPVQQTWSSAGGIAVRSFTSRTGTSAPTVPSTITFEQKLNPLNSLFGNLASSLSFSRQQGMITSLSSQQMSNLHALTLSVLASRGISSSWSEIRSALESKQTSDDERNFRRNLAFGYGKGSPLHKLRLFDESNKEEDVRVTLYRDSASWCPYCQKVWMTLEEKRIPYRIEKINMRCYGEKPSSFMAIQPSGNIPVAIIDGVVYRQSNDIIYALEENFPNHQSMIPYPQGSSEMMKAQELLRLERKIFSAWLNWLTSRDSPDGRLRSNFIAALMEVEKALLSSKGSYFMGKNVSVVDVMFAPFLERMVASLVYFKGFQIRVVHGEKTDYPAVNRWFDAMETLESYQLTKSDYYTHCWDLSPQLGGCVTEAGSEYFRELIDGHSKGSWELPMIPHNGGVEPDWEWAGGYPGDESISKREAVERVTSNHDAIVGFASRGAGKTGFPRYGAPLADPNAVCNESIQPFVSVALQLLCRKLLSDKNENSILFDETMNDVVALWKKEGGAEIVEKVALSLEYLRDRIGVPRDMRLPAARQLRAHINWCIGYLTS